MTSEVLSLAEKKPLRTTTLRVDPEILRKARFYLDQEDKSVNEFLVEQLQQYVQQHDAQGQGPRQTQECA